SPTRWPRWYSARRPASSCSSWAGTPSSKVVSCGPDRRRRSRGRHARRAGGCCGRNHPDGRRLDIAGQVALDQDFGIIGEADLSARTRAAMRNLRTALEAIGADWRDIVRRTIYTVYPTEFETITAAI